MTNALKANVIAIVNAALVLIVSFGVEVSDGQQAAITGIVNAVLVAWVGLTFKASPKRIPD
mgnify:CR=1 FL=1